MLNFWVKSRYTLWIVAFFCGSLSCSKDGDGPDAGQGQQVIPRFFSAESPWNAPIPVDAVYSPEGDARIQKLANPSLVFQVKKSDWTQWVYHAKESDPTVTFFISSTHLPDNTDNSRDGYVEIKMPAEAVPDPGCSTCPGGFRKGWDDGSPGFDGHITIIDPAGEYSHEFWHTGFDENTGNYTAVSYARIPLDGKGVNIQGQLTEKLTGEYRNPDFLTYGWGSSRSYGGSNLGGLIMKGDITEGKIDHALAILMPFSFIGFPESGYPLYPATKAEYACAETGPIVMGTRFAIPRDIDINSLGLSAACKALAKALQEYGAYLIDSAGEGNVNLNADGVGAQGEAEALNARSDEMKKLLSLLRIVQPEDPSINTNTLPKPPGC